MGWQVTNVYANFSIELATFQFSWTSKEFEKCKIIIEILLLESNKKMSEKERPMIS